jgi:hypothetical protein
MRSIAVVVKKATSKMMFSGKRIEHLITLTMKKKELKKSMPILKRYQDQSGN